MRNFYKRYFCIPVQEKVSEKVFLTRISVSLLSMLICVIGLCTGTWAYFTAMVSSETTTIMAATYNLNIQSGEGIEYTEEKTFKCSGNSNHLYTFTLEAIGTAENGYCVIYVEGDSNSPYYTNQIGKDSTLTIQIKAADGTTVLFEPQWGTSATFDSGETLYGEDEMIVCSGAETLIEKPIENDDYILHIVAVGETLVTIAELYQIPVAAICEYNEISEETILIVGQQIAIPKNYDIEDSSEITDEESEEIEPTEDTAIDDSNEIGKTEEANDEDNDDSLAEDDFSDMTNSGETEDPESSNDDELPNSDEGNSNDLTDTETEREEGSQLGDESDLDAHQKSEDSGDIADNEPANNPEISSEEASDDEVVLDSIGDSETDPSEV